MGVGLRFELRLVRIRHRVAQRPVATRQFHFQPTVQTLQLHRVSLGHIKLAQHLLSLVANRVVAVQLVGLREPCVANAVSILRVGGVASGDERFDWVSTLPPAVGRTLLQTEIILACVLCETRHFTAMDRY